MASQQAACPSARILIRAVLVHSRKEYDLEIGGVALLRRRDLEEIKQDAQVFKTVMKIGGETPVLELGREARA